MIIECRTQVELDAALKKASANHTIRLVGGRFSVFGSAHGTSYAPGTTPVADDWDGGKKECGGGLHFSPRPIMTRKFDSDATKFIACPVRLKDMRAPKPDDQYPDKIKAKGCCAPVWEVDIWGNKI